MTYAGHPHYVYRLFDSRGRLLYIGHTSCVHERLSLHLSWANLGNGVTGGLMFRLAAVTMWRYPDKESARAAERAAIEAEAPLLNKHYNKGRYTPLSFDADPWDDLPSDQLLARSWAVCSSAHSDYDYEQGRARILAEAVA